ncbi:MULTISPECIES: hypothetical protein [Actinokineospora]|uniref:Uncharacterized protein n=1 Tax=Actinokineospora fastidiosa TaxID=1816 RepID=A0A918GR70_9PSEU|nr:MULTISPECIES: hypothetical protein [Actinokineospora]UVS78493.1 hypothetical protein Actkin_02226 [Actinokineospora sp. UTMC 2448]GGS55177.1 hypothetical protein GCM10010171_57970 [Actinokineospora fastidiosa]
MSVLDIAPVRTSELTDEVEALLNAPEPEGVFRETEKCALLLLAAGVGLLAPPTPRPKR